MAGIEINYHEWGQISDRSVILSKYSQVCDVETFFYNASDKTIKYVTFEYGAYNAVNDIIATAKRKFTGPLEPDKIDIARFEDVFKNYSSIKRVAIEKVEIEYMDGTVETITKNALLHTKDPSSVYYNKRGKAEMEAAQRAEEEKRAKWAKEKEEQAERAKKIKMVYTIIGIIIAVILVVSVIPSFL